MVPLVLNHQHHHVVGEHGIILETLIQNAERNNNDLCVFSNDVLTRGMLTSLLSKHCTVIEAEDARTGISAFIEHAANIVLLDIHLPDLTGYEVAKRIKFLNHDAYIVMLSADDADADLILAHAAGVAGFVKKPFDKDKILDYIEKAKLKTPDLGESLTSHKMH